MKLKFTNLWTRKESEYETDMGFFAYAFREGFDGKHLGPKGEQFNICLANGAISNPSMDRARVEREMALFFAEYPEFSDKIEIVRVPCAFSTRNGWLHVADAPESELVALAKLVPTRRMSYIMHEAFEKGCPTYLASLRARLIAA